MHTRRIWLLMLMIAALAVTAFAKDPPAQVIVWPEQGNPVVRFTFAKFKEVGMEVVIKVGGTDQRLDRNLVKRILVVQRQPAETANQ